MNLKLTGHHIEITSAMNDYVTAKIKKITRHFDHVIDVNVILSVEKLKQKAEANLHVSGKNIFAEADSADMYASIDTLFDKLNRQVIRYREKKMAYHKDDLAEIISSSDEK